MGVGVNRVEPQKVLAFFLNHTSPHKIISNPLNRLHRIHPDFLSPRLLHSPTKGQFMSSQKQIDANRRNAAKSTGPRTAKGKARVSQNALTHGLTAEALVLPGEEAENFEDLYQGIRETYQPTDNVEEALIHEMAIHRWRLLRYFRMEVGIFWDFYDSGVDHQKSYPYRFAPPADEHQRHTCCLGKVARGCSGEVDRFKSLTRYETAIERGFHRALKTLEMRRNTMAARSARAPRTQEKDDYETNPNQEQTPSNQADTPRIGPSRVALEPNIGPVTLQEPANPGPGRARLSLQEHQSVDVP
jgi:hypothetical protein